MHRVFAFASVHAAPQRPQCITLVCVLVSQPVAASPSQSPLPAPQIKPQRPSTHDAAPMAFIGHALLQAPQCAGSLSVFTQLAPQSINRSGGQTHSPLEHIEPAAHCTPQRPQFARSERTSTHAPPHRVDPSSTSPLQLSSIWLHGISAVEDAVHSHVALRPGTATQLQLGLDGQSWRPLHVRLQRPTARQTPEMHCMSDVHGSPNPPPS